MNYYYMFLFLREHLRFQVQARDLPSKQCHLTRALAAPKWTPLGFCPSMRLGRREPYTGCMLKSWSSGSCTVILLVSMRLGRREPYTGCMLRSWSSGSYTVILLVSMRLGRREPYTGCMLRSWSGGSCTVILLVRL